MGTSTKFLACFYTKICNMRIKVQFPVWKDTSGFLLITTRNFIIIQNCFVGRIIINDDNIVRHLPGFNAMWYSWNHLSKIMKSTSRSFLILCIFFLIYRECSINQEYWQYRQYISAYWRSWHFEINRKISFKNVLNKSWSRIESWGVPVMTSFQLVK